MENISTDTMLQIVVTVAAALALWLRLDAKVDGVRKELKTDIQQMRKTAEDQRKELKKEIQKVGKTTEDQRKELKTDIQQVGKTAEDQRKELKKEIQKVDDKAMKLLEASNKNHLVTIERLTRVEEKVGCIIRGEPLQTD